MAGSNRSITQHPLFPALVTMWFGATFGLCSLVIGKPTLEAGVVATGLPEYLAAARPPLGSTARVLFALAACGIGSLLGLALAAMLVRAKSPEDAAAGPMAEEIADDAIAAHDPDEDLEAEFEPQPEPEPEPELAVAVVAADPAPEESPEAEPDALTRFLRGDPIATQAGSHAPRTPFSVFDELGPDAGIASLGSVEREADDDLADDAAGLTGAHPLADALADAEPIDRDDDLGDDPEDDIVPDFAGSPPLPSNVHAIDAVRLAQHALPTRFANDTEPDPEPEEVSEEAAPVPEIEHEDLTRLSYLQLTERLAQAIAKNPHPPASLRRRSAPGGTSTAVNSPGLERLREVHARTAPANESATPDADQIREALSDLRNFGGAA